MPTEPAPTPDKPGPGQAFPRSARLLDARDYRRVFARPTKSSDAYFNVLARTRRDGSGPRLGLAIARKQARRAVDRNRLKRLARESFRRHRGRLCDLDLVVTCRAAAAAADNATLIDSLESHWRRARERLCDNSST